MAYISYTDVPLYFGTSNNNSTLPGEADALNKSVVAQQVQLNYTPNIAPVRVVGKTPTRDNFNLAGPPNSSLSFSCYIDSDEFNPSDFTGDVGDIGATFRLGNETAGISGSGAFLNSFSYTLTPYAPVLVQCDFAIYNPMTTTVVGGNIVSAGPVSATADLNNDGDVLDAGESAGDFGGDNTLDTANFGDYAHGAYSHIKGGKAGYSQATHEAFTVVADRDGYDQLTGIDQVLDDIETFEAIQYQYTAQRLPVYEVGSYNITKCELITEEQTLSIQGDNIQKLVSITGSNPGKLIIDLNNAAATSPIITSEIDGRLNSENVSIQGGDLARGSITITELLK